MEMILRRWCIALLISSFGTASMAAQEPYAKEAAEVEALSPSEPSRNTQPSRPSDGRRDQEQTPEEEDTSVIRVVHSEIEGKVYIASEEQGIREKPAKDVNVQIREYDSDDVLAETLTNDDGAYTLPKMDLGRYRLMIGGLRLNLSVERESASWSKELRKVIIVIIPKQMARRR